MTSKMVVLRILDVVTVVILSVLAPSAAGLPIE